MFGSKRVLVLTKLQFLAPFAESVLGALTCVLCAGAVVVALMNEGVLQLATIDNATDGPRFGRYRPHPDARGGDDAD